MARGGEKKKFIVEALFAYLSATNIKLKINIKYILTVLSKGKIWYVFFFITLSQNL
jgi:hypothetical protein